MDGFQNYVTTASWSPAEIAARTGAIRDQLLGKSRTVQTPNFGRIHSEDLRYLFGSYDQSFFQHELARRLGAGQISFRLSRRLTSSAGKTTRRTIRRRMREPTVEFEICVSATLLFQTFQDVDRPVTVTGISCRDRLDALQRIFEHELIHLIEMLLWTQSNCAAPRFQSIAERFFGHKEHTHQLITQRERAFAKFGLKVGDRVSFRFEGRHHEGILNRVTRRATVLIEDPRGQRYSDGKTYAKFYVPLSQLKGVD
jgi:hypothetical protein